MAEFTLHLLHATDQEGAAPALVDAPNLSAVLNALEDDFENTLILSAGDLWLPGLFYTASEEVYGFTNEEGEFEGVPGIADILINSTLGFEAVAFGNHEFDQGTGSIAALLAANPDITGPGIGEEGYQGAAFPYLSANLDFSADPNLSDLVVEDGQDVNDIEGNIAKSAIATVGGEKIGLVGVTTPTLPTVSSPGDDVDVNPDDPDDFDALAAIIQAEVDELLANNPDLNKVILLSHMQVLDIEVNELAPRLSGVDIIIGGGSDSILADEFDRLRDGDDADGPYPIIKEGADGNPVAIVNTDGQYLYVGQLVVDFNENGVIILDSIDPMVSGAYATDEEGVAALGAEGLTDPVVTEVIAALNEVIEEKERNVFGVTEVFLNGRRSGGGLDGVRNQETNLGNLTAEANLWYARLFDEDVDISIKNGGGIRESIGAVVTPPGGTEPVRVPPEGNPNFDKPEGGITQTDVESVLAFNNGLSVVTATVEELKAILEHAVSGATEENINSDFGSFAQIAGIQFSFDITFEPGNRVRSLTLTDDEGNDTEVLVQNGEIQGAPSRTYRLVTLNFLADGGSGYPIPQTDRIDLVEQGDEDQDLADFAETGSEQDAFAEYLAAFFPADEDPATPVFMMEDTVVSEDERIQNLFFREDTVIDGTMPPVEEPEDPDFSDGFEGPFSEIGRLILEEGAEINAFDPASATLFVVSGGSILQAVDLSDPANPVLSELIDLGVFGGGVNSVAVKDGIVALAVEARTATDEGSVVFLTTDGQFLESIGVGAVPDMVTFTPDGSKVLVANEGEPNDDYSIDPEGSVSIIDISSGVENATTTIADFTAFNGQKAELQAEGVKLFGLDATVAEDLEPEYIAVSPDGSTAWVTLQENNAVAVVDIENATVQAILPLGAKDFSKGQPNLTSYEISDRGPITNGGEALTTAEGETIELGGFSGLFYDGMAENGNLKFLAVPDRGPNGDADGGDRPFLLPDYQARVVFLELNEVSGEVSITDQLFLTQAEGTPITGLPNIPNEDRRAVDALGNPVDLEAITELDASEFGADYDPLGADMEGIVRAGDGTYWMVDEYRPAIYHFDTDGTLINRFVPEGTRALANELNPDADFDLGTFGTETLPAEYVNRRANRGFEGMALDTDEGILYAFIQTPLSNPDRESGDNSNVIRMLGIDPTSGEPVAEYVYLLQKPDIGGNVDKIGDAVYAGDGKFFVMERDSSLEPTAQKFIFEVDLKGATNVLGADFGGETLEQQTADDLAALGINPVNKLKVTNLPSLGYLPSDKPEGLAYLPDGRLVVLNDNDFGLEPGAEAVELGIIDFGDGNQLDASNEDDGINIQNWPVFGLYQPDAIASYEVDGITYYITANEGDARLRPDGDLEDEDGNVILEEGAVFNEENRIGDEEIVLDPEAFPNAEELKLDENLGRLNITNTLGDTDGDGDFDQLFSYGGRSFSIWDENGNLVFDSSDDIANITAQLTPDLFNANDGISEEFDERSDDKGAEPEAVTVGQIGDTIYAFVSLERAGGGVLIYDVTNPTEAEFVQYARNDEDIAPEGLTFISDFDSPNGNNLLVVTNEESNTLTIYSDGDGEGGGGTGTTSIFDIQGTGHISPLLGDTVTTTGIVTAVDTNGFYIQDAEGDGDIATSDALFVFTGGEPVVTVGDALNVTGTVSEFTPGGPDTGNLSATQISGDLEIEVLSSGNDLPEAVIIGEGGRIPPNASIDDDAFASFDPNADGIDFFESLEAMRVTAQDALAISGTNRFGEIFTVVDNGASATGISDRGTLNISPDDFNPEKVQIDEDSGIFDFDFPSVDVGAFLGDVTGVVGYGFGNFEIYPTEDFTANIVPSGLEPEFSEIQNGEDKLTVASYNLLNLDPNDEDGDSDLSNGRFEAIAQQIVNNLNTPDIIGLQEIQDNDGAEITEVSAADETLQTLIDEIAAAGGPTYQLIDTPNVLPTFIDEDGNVVRPSGGQPGGNIRNAFLYNPDRVDLVEGSVQPIGSQEVGATFEGARRPLSATFEFNGEDITIVNNHFSSKGGSAPILGVEQPFEQRQEDPDVNGSLNERRVQAQAVNDFMDDIFAEDADANVVVLGDLNEFEFISPLDILAGTVESTDNGFGIEPTGEEAILTNLVNEIAPDERYSFIFQGNSQVLDHILVSDSLFDGAEFDFVTVNSEFAETNSRASDHDPLLASFAFGDTDDSDGSDDLSEVVDQIFAEITDRVEDLFGDFLDFLVTDVRDTVDDLLMGGLGEIADPGSMNSNPDEETLVTPNMGTMLSSRPIMPSVGDVVDIDISGEMMSSINTMGEAAFGNEDPMLTAVPAEAVA